MPKLPLIRAFSWLIIAPLLVHCTKNQGNTTYDLNLYSGIRQLVALGDAEAQVKSKVKFDFERQDYKEDTRSIAMTLSRLNITHSYKYSDLGTTVYFRDKRVVLIELQPPFKGEIQGKKMTLFDFKVPGDKTWEDILVRKLGGPVARASGGKFGSEALFYSWGDVSYNRMGLNQVALYRDPGISRYRQKNFGRDLKLFNN
jgi:hypothetical protein